MKKDNNNNLLVGMVVIICVIVLLSLFGFSGMMGPGFGGYGMMGMMGGSYGYGPMFFGWITSVLIIILIIAAINWLIKSANKK